MHDSNAQTLQDLVAKVMADSPLDVALTHYPNVNTPTIIREVQPQEPANVEVLNSKEMSPRDARYARFSQVMGKFASTLTLRPILVEITGEHVDAPAWSDSDSITFNRFKLGGINTPEEVLSLKGLGLHEISHVLFTPRNGSILAKNVQKAKLWGSFNALEDQRIEMLMTKRFGNVADWLTATVAQHIVAEPEQHSLAFAILHGRKYLPVDLRNQMAALYERQEDLVELGKIIDDYIVLNLADAKNYSAAYDLIVRYDTLLNNIQPNWNANSYQHERGVQRIKDPNGHKERSKKGGEYGAGKTKPLSRKEQDALVAKIAQDAANQQPLEPREVAQGDGQQGDESNEAQAGSGAGNIYDATGNDEARDIAEKIINDVKKRLAKEISTAMKQYSGEVELQGGKAIAPPRLINEQSRTVSANAVLAAKSFAQELERLRAEHDPAWNRLQDNGRLSVQRYISDSPIDECFDEWDNGREDAVDIECVILVDISPSMGDMLTPTYESMWAIKRAMDKVGASTTVVAYNNTSYLVYSAKERALSTMKYARLNGGTDPLASLKYAKNILAESKRAVKLCITITDGAWGLNSTASDRIIRELRRGGVLTALAFVDDISLTYGNVQVDSHGAEVTARITDVSELFALSRNLVKAGIRRNLQLA